MAHERFAPGQFDALNGQVTAENAGDVGHFLQGEQLRTIQRGRPVGRHTVTATEIAAIRDRQPELTDRLQRARLQDHLPHGCARQSAQRSNRNLLPRTIRVAVHRSTLSLPLDRILARNPPRPCKAFSAPGAIAESIQ